MLKRKWQKPRWKKSVNQKAIIKWACTLLKINQFLILFCSKSWPIDVKNWTFPKENLEGGFLDLVTINHDPVSTILWFDYLQIAMELEQNRTIDFVHNRKGNDFGTNINIKDFQCLTARVIYNIALESKFSKTHKSI